MKKTALIALAFLASAAMAQTATITAQQDRGYQPMNGTRNVGGPVGTEAACDAVLIAEGVRLRKTILAKCRHERVKTVTFNPAVPVTCDPSPAPTQQVIQCVSPLVGSWTQTTTTAIGPAPGCARSTTVSPLAAPAGACTTPPPSPPPAPPGAAVYYFSDCQTGSAAGCTPGSNANPGTQDRPKQNFAGINLDALPAGSQLLLKRGGSWNVQYLSIENPNTTAAAPLTFDAYGTGPAPLLRTAGGNAFNLGGGWGNTSNDGGYTFRNLKLDGLGTGEWGIWFVQNVRDVVIENTEITGFRIAVNSNDGTPYGVRGVTLRNNNIHHNRAMGLLGHYDNLLMEGNTIEANNFGGSTFDHGTYIGGGNNITVRNNRYLRNSVVNGTCTGGNMTFHGQIDGLLIEGNTIDQDAGTPGCYLMSITQGYSTAEWFRNAVVRNNRLSNGGSAIVVQSAPGIVVEGNVIVNANPTRMVGVAIGGQYAGGDVPDADAVVRNNILCRRAAAATGEVTSVASPGSTLSANVLRTGTEAATGPCAP